MEQTRIHYGIEEDFSLTLDVPDDILQETLEHSRLAEILQRPEGVVKRRDIDQGAQLLFDIAPFLSVKKDENRDAYLDSYAKQWLHTFVKVKEHTPEGRGDVSIDVDMSLNALDDASGQMRRGMTAAIEWPLVDDETARRRTTTVMRMTAVALGIIPKSLSDSAYAIVDRKGGVELQALDVGCCCLSVNGMDYSPDDKKVQLYGHNLYNHRLQLTCLSGVIALGREHTP